MGGHRDPLRRASAVRFPLPNLPPARLQCRPRSRSLPALQVQGWFSNQQAQKESEGRTLCLLLGCVRRFQNPCCLGTDLAAHPGRGGGSPAFLVTTDVRSRPYILLGAGQSRAPRLRDREEGWRTRDRTEHPLQPGEKASSPPPPLSCRTDQWPALLLLPVQPPTPRKTGGLLIIRPANKRYKEKMVFKQTKMKPSRAHLHGLTPNCR